MFYWKVINFKLIKVNAFTKHVAFFFLQKEAWGPDIFSHASSIIWYVTVLFPHIFFSL